MSGKTRKSTCTSYMYPAQIFFMVSIILLILYWIWGRLCLPSEQEVSNEKCRVFEAQWERILDTGERVPVDVPGKVDAGAGEVVTISAILPEDVYCGEALCFRPIWQDVEIYINGQLRLSYNTKHTRPFGINSTMRYLFVDLTEEDAGAVLTYRFSSNSKYAGNMQTVYIGDRLGIWAHMARVSGFRSLLSIALIMLSCFCLMVIWILKFAYKRDLSLNYLAWTILLCAVWMLSESDFRQLLFRNLSVLSNVTYWCLLLIPFPMIIYIDNVQKNYYRKLYVFPITYATTVLIMGTILQVFDIVQFVQQIPFIHGGLIFSIICIVVTITMDAFKGRLKDYAAVGIGIYGLLLTAVIEMSLYYFGVDISLGTVLGIGLLFLLIMAIIKTGQDLFQTEKNKQEAILAREAQAKFLANMSHEIRTPINAIIGMNEMILRENTDEEIRDYAHNIQSASKMLLGLVNDVLDFSKIESGRLELVEDTYHLGALLQDATILMNARVAGKPISTYVDIDPQLPSKYVGDELRIKQVLTNVLSNAVKYTKEGSVTLKATYIPLDREQVMLSLSVTDTGIGIKKEDIPLLFDGFKRLELEKNRNIQGTGLGLNIAKQLVSQMRGNIVVDSEYGKGSTFTIFIPQRVVDRQPLGSLKESLDNSRKENGVSKNWFIAPEAKILIVDDNSMNLSLMKGLLKRTQMQVDTAKSGSECLELSADKRYDIIFMDHMMPEMDGVETLKRLRADYANPNRNAVVIALTANAVAGCQEMYLDYGFNDYFTKPIQADQLDELIARYLPKNLVIMQGEQDSGLSTGEKTLSEVSEELLEIDRRMGLSYCMDMEDFYADMCGEFCKQAREYLPQLEEHFNNCDWKQYAIVTHALKSNALNIGAVNFSNLSKQHEFAGKEENVEFIKREYPVYIQALKALVNKLQER